LPAADRESSDDSEDTEAPMPSWTWGRGAPQQQITKPPTGKSKSDKKLLGAKEKARLRKAELAEKRAGRATARAGGFDMDALHARLLEAADADSDGELERAGKYSYIGVEALPQHTRKVVFRLGALLYYDYKEQGGGQRKSGILTACCTASGKRKRPTPQQREAAAALMEKWHKSVEGAASREILEAAGKRFAEGKERRRAEREERHGARFDPDAAVGEAAGPGASGKRKVDRKKETAKKACGGGKRGGGGRGKGRGDDIMASGAQLRNCFTAFIAASDGGMLPNVLEAPVVGAPPEGSSVIVVAAEANTARARRSSGSGSSESSATFGGSDSSDDDEDDDLLLSCSDDEDSEAEEDDELIGESGSDESDSVTGEGSAPGGSGAQQGGAVGAAVPTHNAAAKATGALPTASAASHVHKPAAHDAHRHGSHAAGAGRSSHGYVTPHIGLGYADPVPFVSSGTLHPVDEAAEAAVTSSPVKAAVEARASTAEGDSASASPAAAAAVGTPVRAPLPCVSEAPEHAAPAAATPTPAAAPAQRTASSSHGKWSAGRPLGSGGKVSLPSSVVSSPYVDVQTHQLFVDSSLRGEWERHTTGIGSKLLARMGYSGGQLGSRDRTSTGGGAGAGSPWPRSPATPARPAVAAPGSAETPAGVDDGAASSGGAAGVESSPALRLRKDGRVQVSATAPMPEPVSAEKRTGRAGIGAPMGM
jgi:hypothetical protein